MRGATEVARVWGSKAEQPRRERASRDPKRPQAIPGDSKRSQAIPGDSKSAARHGAHTLLLVDVLTLGVLVACREDIDDALAIAPVLAATRTETGSVR